MVCQIPPEISSDSMPLDNLGDSYSTAEFPLLYFFFDRVPAGA